jgi:aryl-alcohol dehydrogenase-like predicted oxidoreductase
VVELAPLALDQGMALVPWSPLKNGFLSGKYRRGTQVADSARAAHVGGPDDDQFAVIDGEPSAVYPPLTESAVRY